MPYSSFRPLYLCTFASNKSCLTEIHRKSQNLRPLPSHYLTLWEKLINSLFLIHSYFNIGFCDKTQVFNEITKTTSHFCGISLRVFAVIRLKVCSPDSPPCLTKCCMRSWRSAAWGCHAVLPERLTKHGVRGSGSTSSRHTTPLFWKTRKHKEK